MIWRVVVVVICIVIVVSAVWAASDSFEVRVDGPKTFGDNFVIPTPTPMPLQVNYSFQMENRQNGPESIYIDVPLPNTHVVLMKGNRVDQLGQFHLCRGKLSRCNGGIQSFDANYIDWQGDGIAERLRVYFAWEDFKTLLSTTDSGISGADSADSSSDIAVTSGALTNTDTSAAIPSAFTEPSTDRYSRIRLTISGNLYAWKLAQP